jgi:iron complex outermembrane recepter protein
MRKSTLLVMSSLVSLAIGIAPAQAQDDSSADASRSEGGSDNGTIIVTANKRAEAVNDVPMSITAISGDALVTAGVRGVEDLGRVTPGFTFTKTHDSIPVLSVRGIGYYDNFIGATPAVSAYSDEVPLPYPVLTGGALLDLERVEVLKGPQGTLFGQNSTGGAINFIAAKPQDQLGGEFSLSYGRFGATEISGHITGPLSETVSARFAGKWEGRQEWQRSYTRPVELGQVDRGAGRLLLDYDNRGGFSAELAVEAWYDRSDSQAPQLSGILIALPGFQNPGLATGDPDGFFGEPTPIEQVYPNSPRNVRAADWSPGNYASDNEYWRTSLRMDYDLSDAATLTSITAYQRFDQEMHTDVDGTSLEVGDFRAIGDIESFSQELRASGQAGPISWTIGGNYSDNTVAWVGPSNFRDWSVFVNNLNVSTATDDRTLAAFASFEAELSPVISLIAGARYTDNRQHMTGCPSDSGDGLAAFAINFFRTIQGRPGNDIQPGQCYSLNDLDGSFTAEEADLTLHEDNVSWRLGVNVTPTPDLLLYANISRGYKAGAFTLATFDVHSQALPARQESVLAYEAGFKFEGDQFQFNGAGFYYDYSDKQLLAPFFIENFGLLDKLQNVPESRVAGAELQFIWTPAPGLRLSANGTYIDSKVTSDFFAADPLGGPTQINLNGLTFPYTARWQGAGDASYTFDVSDELEATLGAALTTRSKSVGRFGGGQAFGMDGYTLLDLRAGVETIDGTYAIEIYGRNVTNQYYRTNVTSNADTIIAFAGMPATYGVRGTVRF